MGDASKWVGSQTKPVVLLHHEQLTAKQTQHRLLANSSNAYMPLSEEEISSYQVFAIVICLVWPRNSCVSRADLLLVVFCFCCFALDRCDVHLFNGGYPR